ncbi:MAG TPA: PAS domain-containing protein, partial [bacterium]|nr:PAS domain-containing protein [bacterium]
MNYRNAAEKNNTANADDLLVSIVKSIHDPFYSVALDGVLSSWNPGAQRVYGFTPEEITGQNLSFLIPPHRRDESTPLLEKVWEGKAVADFVTIHRTKQGKEVRLSLTLSPIQDGLGRVTGASIIAREVPENEKADAVQETLLGERDELFERLQLQIESMPIAYILTNQDLQFTYWNPAAENTFGYSFREVEGKSGKENIVPPSEVSAVEDLIRKLIRGDAQGREPILAKNIRKDGRIIICEWYSTPLRDSKGDFLGFMSMAIDVTERQKSDEMRSQLGAILAQTTDAIIGTDLEGLVFSWNHGAEAMYGYTPEEILGHDVTVLIPDNLKQELSKMNDVNQGAAVSNYETVRMHKNGSLIEVSTTVSPIRDFQGKIIGVSAISRNIT